MRERNIALIGFRATGKSTVGEILALDLGMEFIDMDQRLTSDAGRDIATWVKQDGWDCFRKAESALLDLVSLRHGLVVATGGGIVLDARSRRVLSERFFTVWLKAAPETIYARLRSDPESAQTRPPLSDLPMQEEIRKVLCEREPLYAQAALIEIDTEAKGAALIAAEIAVLFKKIRRREPEPLDWDPGTFQ
jgi:shikimate kinase